MIVFGGSGQGDLDRTFADGEVIFREGDESREMYIVREGTVAIVKRIGQEEIVLARRGRGEFFGEMSLLESLPRIGTARAEGKVRLLVLHAGGFLQMIRRDPAFAFEMLQRLSGRFRQLNEQMAEFLSSLDEADPARQKLAALLEVGPSTKPGGP
ncbi:MAG: cyclic nucleotide-binding domain-containing protein [Rhodospirillales bacterium]|nr:cyclic nucleotide-binding domain-containing protein [Rhodospirillales bacterium]